MRYAWNVEKRRTALARNTCSKRLYFGVLFRNAICVTEMFKLSFVGCLPHILTDIHAMARQVTI